MRAIYIIYCLIVSATITSCNYGQTSTYRSWGGSSGYSTGTGGGGSFHK